MWADVLTKEIEMHKDLQKLLCESNFSLENGGVNKVKCYDGEIRMTNIRNRERQVMQEEKEEV